MNKSGKSNAPWAIHGEAQISDHTELESIISLNQAVKYLAGKHLLTSDPVETIKDRIRKAITSAENKGKLAAHGARTYVFSDFVRWARGNKKYSQFVGHIPLPNSGFGAAVMPAMTVRAGGFQDPATVTEWRKFVTELRGRITELEAEVEKLRAENASLQPFKDADDMRRMNGRKGGQKGGRGRKQT